MKGFNYLRFEIWPLVKTRVIYWWWIIRYGGKKNIPPEVVIETINKTMDNLMFDINSAVRAMPQDASEEEKKLAFEAFAKIQNLESEIKKLK